MFANLPYRWNTAWRPVPRWTSRGVNCIQARWHCGACIHDISKDMVRGVTIQRWEGTFFSWVYSICWFVTRRNHYKYYLHPLFFKFWNSGFQILIQIDSGKTFKIPKTLTLFRSPACTNCALHVNVRTDGLERYWGSLRLSHYFASIELCTATVTNLKTRFEKTKLSSLFASLFSRFTSQVPNRIVQRTPPSPSTAYRSTLVARRSHRCAAFDGRPVFDAH